MGALEGRVAIITGAGRGIGRAIAERYALLGAAVAVNYAKDDKSAADTVAAIRSGGGSAVAIQGDVSKVADIDRLFAATAEQLGGIDIVVVNAGVEQVDQRVLEFTEADFDRLFGVNTKGAFFTLQRAAKHIRDNGRIIYVGALDVPGDPAICLGLRRAFSLTFRAGLFPLSGRRRADRQPSDPLAPPAGRRRRFLFRECRIGATMAPARSAAPGELSDLRGRRAQHPDRDRTEMDCARVVAAKPPVPEKLLHRGK